MQVYIRPKKILLGSSLAFNLKEGPVRCAKVCNKSWVILRLSNEVFEDLIPLGSSLILVPETPRIKIMVSKKLPILITAKRILERRGRQTSLSLVKI